MLTRRHTMLGGLLTIVFGYSYAPCCYSSKGGGQYKGCYLGGSAARQLVDAKAVQTFSTGAEPIRTSGNKDFDTALAHTLAKLSTTLNILPGFAYYDDNSAMNAFATPSPLLDRTDGTIMFGLGLLGRLLSSNDHPELSVAAVCAHEFGHIYQFKHGLIDIVNEGSSTVRRSELQADYFAGYFSGIRKREKPNFAAAVFAHTQHNFGDNMVDHPEHHGTPKERANAIVAGFHFAMAGHTLQDATKESTSYVLSI